MVQLLISNFSFSFQVCIIAVILISPTPTTLVSAKTLHTLVNLNICWNKTLVQVAFTVQTFYCSHVFTSVVSSTKGSVVDVKHCRGIRLPTNSWAQNGSHILSVLFHATCVTSLRCTVIDGRIVFTAYPTFSCMSMTSVCRAIGNFNTRKLNSLISCYV